MQWPEWIRDNTTQWIVAAVALPVLFFIFPYLFSNPTPTTDDHSVKIQGDRNTINYQHITIDTDALVEKLAAKIKVVQNEPNAKDEEIKNLKITIANLQKDSSNALKQQALKALEDGDTRKATSLMKESAEKRTAQTQKLSKEASQDWFDIGNIAYLHDSQKALDAYQRALEFDPSNVVAWNRSGHILKRLGRLDKAMDAYQQVLKLADDDQSIKAVAYGNLGTIYKTRGDLDNAESFLLKSLKINEALGYQEGMASAYGNLGNIYRVRGDLDDAESFQLKALKIDEALGYQEGMASDYGNLGDIYFTRDDLDNAESFYLKALKIDEALGLQEGMASEYGNLGNIYRVRGDLDNAESFYLKALKINEDLGRQVGMASNYSNLGNIYYTGGDLDNAEFFYLKALKINEDLGRQVGMASAYGNLGFIYKTRGDLDKACEALQNTLALFTNIGAKSQMEKTHGLIQKHCSTAP